MTKFFNIIDGENIGQSFRPNINPSDTNDVIGEFAVAGDHDALDAISVAHQRAPMWAATVPYQRGQILAKAAAILHERKEDLGRELSREEGKTLKEGLGEIVRAAQIFDFYAAECVRISGEAIPSIQPNVDIITRRDPVGVVGVITPWNYPIAIPAWKIAPALCYGNTVVFKPAELVPNSARALVAILHEAGLPAGVVNLVCGPGSSVGQTILESKDIDAVTFTGSVAVGRAVAKACAERMCKVQLEMGGKNPFIVLEDADIDHAAACAIDGAFFSTGQRCTASSRLIVSDKVHDAFVEAVSARMAHLNVGHAMDERTDIGPVVSQAQLESNRSYFEIGKSEGAQLLVGDSSTFASTGFFMEPVLFGGASNDMRIAQDEIFGPIACVIPVSGFEEAMNIANATEFGLSSAIFTNNLSQAVEFSKTIRAGMSFVNRQTAGVDFHVPFGGTKASSYGPREQGRSAVEFYTYCRTHYTGHVD